MNLESYTTGRMIQTFVTTLVISSTYTTPNMSADRSCGCHMMWLSVGRNAVCEEWENYLKGFKTTKYRFLEIPVEGSKRRELRNFVRKDVPSAYRQKLWGR